LGHYQGFLLLVVIYTRIHFFVLLDRYLMDECCLRRVVRLSVVDFVHLLLDKRLDDFLTIELVVTHLKSYFR